MGRYIVRVARQNQKFIIFNLKIIIGTLILYMMNQHWIKDLTANKFIHYYMNDILSIGILVPYCNILLSLLQNPRFLLSGLKQIMLFLLLVGVFWEFITPLYKESYTDYGDLVAYFSGGLIYYFLLLVHTRRRF